MEGKLSICVLEPWAEMLLRDQGRDVMGSPDVCVCVLAKAK